MAPGVLKDINHYIIEGRLLRNAIIKSSPQAEESDSDVEDTTAGPENLHSYIKSMLDELKQDQGAYEHYKQLSKQYSRQLHSMQSPNYLLASLLNNNVEEDPAV